jgi:hypothetical protein
MEAHCASCSGKSVAVGRWFGSNRAVRMLMVHGPRVGPAQGCLTRQVMTAYRHTSLAVGGVHGGGDCEEGRTDRADVAGTSQAGTRNTARIPPRHAHRSASASVPDGRRVDRYGPFDTAIRDEAIVDADQGIRRAGQCDACLHRPHNPCLAMTWSQLNRRSWRVGYLAPQASGADQGGIIRLPERVSREDTKVLPQLDRLCLAWIRYGSRGPGERRASDPSIFC